MATAEAVLIALGLHGHRPSPGIDVVAAEIGLPPRTLRHPDSNADSCNSTASLGKDPAKFGWIQRLEITRKFPLLRLFLPGRRNPCYCSRFVPSGDDHGFFPSGDAGAAPADRLAPPAEALALAAPAGGGCDGNGAVNV